MERKIIVVGGVAGGASAAARIRRLDGNARIHMFERGRHVSFSNCALPYYLGGTVEKSESLVMMTPEKFKAQHDIDVFPGHEVIRLFPKEKQVVVKNLQTGEQWTESYDKLVLSPGASPVRPAGIEGVDMDHVFTIRNVDDITRLKQYLTEREIKETVVAGGGFIGLEVAENLVKLGIHVTLLEGAPQVMAPFDHDMVQTIHRELFDHGIDLLLSTRLKKITKDAVTAETGGEEKQIPAGAVVLSIGVRPETGLAVEAGLAIGTTGGILVNHNFQTSDPDIYAVGDVIEWHQALTAKPGRLALAGPAQRQARAAADHMYGGSVRNKGFIGSSCIRVFEQNAACTGINEAMAERAGIPHDSIYILTNDKVGLMPDSHYLGLKVVFEVPTGRILGAQAIGKGSADKRIDVLAAMISMGADLEDIKELELCYSPAFGTAKDAVNLAGMAGLNLLHQKYRQVHVDKVRELVESGAYILDVREKPERERGHIKGSHFIPLSQLRQRAGEIPKDIPVYIHCRSAQRSYYAAVCLQHLGYQNVFSISGSFLGICLYEYFQDQSQGREPVVTDYNFD